MLVQTVSRGRTGVKLAKLLAKLLGDGRGDVGVKKEAHRH